MTKKAIARFAEVVKADVDVSARFGAAEMKRTLDAAQYAADLFARWASFDDPKFDREQFMHACGFRPGFMP